MGMDVQTVVDEIGHDGSEVTHAGLPSPLCYKGFHPQEITEVALKRGFAMTRIAVIPCTVPHELSAKVTTLLGADDGRENLFRHMLDSMGIVDGKSKIGNGHALSYHGHSENQGVEVLCPSSTRTVWIKSAKDIPPMLGDVIAIWRLDELR